MAGKYRLISDLYDETAKAVTKDKESWKRFLKTAGFNYKLRFDEQLLVYAQRPDATAILEIKKWNNTFHRWVNKGAKGIAVFDNNYRGKQRLKYYFDISDTHEGRYLVRVPLWSMKTEYEAEVIEALEGVYGELDGATGIKEAVRTAAENGAYDHIDDYFHMLRESKESSFLENFDDHNLLVALREIVTESVNYLISSRLGIIQSEDEYSFEGLSDFNTRETLNALGFATSDIAKMGLDEVAKTIRTLDQRNRTFDEKKESPYNLENTDEVGRDKDEYNLHEAGRLSDTGSQLAQAAGNSFRSMGDKTKEVSDGREESDILQSADIMQSEPAFGRGGEGSGEYGAETDRADEEKGEHYGGTEEKQSDEVDRADEQHQAFGGGDRLTEPDLQLEYFDRKTEDRSLPFFNFKKMSEAFRSILTEGELSKIEAFYRDNVDEKERIQYLKHVFAEAGESNTSNFDYKLYDNVLFICEGDLESPLSGAYCDWAVIASYFDGLMLTGELYESIPAENFTFSQEVIDEALTRGSGISNGKYRIYEQFEKSLSRKENAEFLKHEYGIGGTSEMKIGTGISQWHDAKGIKLSRGFSDNSPEILIKWNEAAKRIDELIKLGRYLNPKELESYPKWLEERKQQKEEAAFSEDKEMADETIDIKELAFKVRTFAEETDPYDFYNNYEDGSSEEDILRIYEEYLKDPESRKEVAVYLENLLEEAQDEDLAKEALTLLKDLEKNITGFEYHLGDTVYIGAQQYEILSLDDKQIVLYDESCPLINKTLDREDFERRVRETPGNDHLIFTLEASDHGKDNVIDEVAEPEEAGGGFEKPAETEDLIPSWEIEEKQVPQIDFFTGEKRNFRIEDDLEGSFSKKEKFRDNLEAIKLLKQLEAEGRYASHDEQKILSKYVGWGGLSEAFNPENSSWTDEYMQLKSLLTEEQYQSARESTLTSFYTPKVVIDAIYKAFEQMGFRQGNILEPACGIGKFMGLLPESMKESRMYGVELDEVSGNITRQLYPENNIAVDGFENVSLPDSFFDAAIGNVPFGDFSVADKRYDKYKWLIHDYFFGKTLDKVRPGGIIAFITSKGTMDKENSSVRKYIAQRADLLGAIRLPNDTFKNNAGTEVTSDIIFLQKRDRVIEADPEWIYLNKDENGIAMNSYFVSHPEMILGEMKMISGRFGPESACVPHEDSELKELLSDAIVNIHAEIAEYEEIELEEEEESISADPDVKNFSYAVAHGKVYFRENSRMYPQDVSKTAESRIKGLIEIRESVRQLIYYQTEDYPAEQIKDQQLNLNQIYDRFVKKYGRINSRANNSAFGEDSSYFLLAALEIFDDKGNFLRKADMFSKRTIKPNVPADHCDTASEALALSIGEKGYINMEYMCDLTGRNETELYEELKGIIFLNPEYGEKYDAKKYISADEYLSGNIREKLRKAVKLSEMDDEYRLHVQSLEKVKPKDLSASEIKVRLGATWISVDVISDFMYELLDTPRYVQNRVAVHFSEFTGEWNIEGKNADRGNVKAYSTYGTKRINAYKIIEETLNLKDVRIFDYVEDDEGRKQAILNKKETAIAQGKQEQIKKAFVDWIWKDPQRRQHLTEIYNERFNAIRPREYDGSHILFNGMNPEVTLKQHQKGAVAHILYGGNTLLAHAVGAGKTYEMAAAAMESKRLGLCSKSLFVVPNHITGQFAAEFLTLYPSANIMVATKKDFQAKNRKKLCARIATGDFDAVIIGHTQFEKIPMSMERQRIHLEQQIEEITAGIEELKRNRGEKFSIKSLERSRKQLKTKLKKLNDQSRKDDVVTFEELGVDRLFIDEAHYYKNLYLYTKMRNVVGISQTEAQKSSDMFMKCRYMDEVTGNKGNIFATGTPISNSMVELYTLQRYLQYDTLKKHSLQHFDAWASTFGETITAIELAPEGSGYRAKTRFAKFYNLPELMSMFKEIADIKTSDMLNLPVPKANYHNIAVKPSEFQKKMVSELSERADRVRNRMVTPNEDNMLKITNDGRKLALDQRMMNESLPDFEGSKINACVDNIYKLWTDNQEKRLTQLVFCDLSTPKSDGGFNVYDDIRDKLIKRGVPEGEIKFIHEADSEAKKNTLFSKVRSGDVRILLGSTQKMGAGTNVQNKLIALHDIDCPWRPSDLEQRSGRIIRQGNENSEVEIFRYVTEGTFDAYLYQLIENKQKFISQIMTSKSPVREAEDIDEMALSYAEIKVLAMENPYIKEKMDLDIQVSKLKLLKQNFLSEKYALEDKLVKYYPAEIKGYEERIAGLKEDIAYLKSQPENSKGEFAGMTVKGQRYAEKPEAGKAILEACKAMKNPDQIPLGEYSGFDMSLSFNKVSREYEVEMRHAMRYKVSLGADALGNIRRLDNALDGIEKRLLDVTDEYQNVIKQYENAKIQVQEPFASEEELIQKAKRLDELNILLNMGEKDMPVTDESPEMIVEDDREKGIER